MNFSKEILQKNFSDLHPPLTSEQANLETSRCYFCHDAPCIEACPTGINIPEFIQRIRSGNVKGAAMEILGANIMGGTCARACPVEILCEEACVRNEQEMKPVAIGLLQRHAVDHLLKTNEEKKLPHPFKREAPTGKKIAVVGGGPAGLSCAHRLAVFGHDVEVFEAKEKLGGLNEYGLAAYKMTNDFAKKEVDFLLSVGGIKARTGQKLGEDLKLQDLVSRFDAVFLAIGLGGTRSLELSGEKHPSIQNAVDWIEELRSTELSKMKPKKRVIVIGGGNTAIDAAVQSKKLGSEEVHLVYRRGPKEMSATQYEQDLSKTEGVVVHHYLKPVEFKSNEDGSMTAEFQKNDPSKEKISIHCDLVLKAIGQILVTDSLTLGTSLLELKDGKILADEKRRTSQKKIYAGGDAIGVSQDLTVSAIEDGKIAAHSIDQDLMGRVKPWRI